MKEYHGENVKQLIKELTKHYRNIKNLLISGADPEILYGRNLVEQIDYLDLRRHELRLDFLLDITLLFGERLLFAATTNLCFTWTFSNTPLWTTVWVLSTTTTSRLASARLPGTNVNPLFFKPTRQPLTRFTRSGPARVRYLPPRDLYVFTSHQKHRLTAKPCIFFLPPL